VDGIDDLAAVDSLEVDAGDAEVGMTSMPLDDVEGNGFARHLDGVRVSELVRGEPTANPNRDGELAQRARAAIGDHGRPRVGPSITQGTAPPRVLTRIWIHASRCSLFGSPWMIVGENSGLGRPAG
jgi:hypothetical protein